MDITQHLAQRVQQLRATHGWTLHTLAERSGVSRSAISLIERGETSPSAVVLDKLATALGITVAGLFAAEAVPAEAPSPLTRPDTQSVWVDPASGYERRALSSPAGGPLQLAEVRFPAGQTVAFESGPRAPRVHQQIWLLDGRMQITLGPQSWTLQPGDCLSMWLDQPISFHNPARRAARYLVALVTLNPMPGAATAATPTTTSRSTP